MNDYIVATTSGKVQGHLRNGLIEYLGIPYAQPPVGELRFKRARPIAPWEGIFDAKEYGSPAIQNEEGALKGSEDCLTINIKRPAEGENLPVFVYIHGGGYSTGFCSLPLYHGDAFAKDGIIYVAFQYRLSVLGFYDFTTYPGCEDFESNCGLSDQILAMKWMHDNIAAFGGDPNRVTICGESAGGASVINMLAIPSVKGMFQQAIAESGLPNCVMTHEMARRNIQLFLEGMGWTEADLPRLKTLDPFEMLKGNEHVAEFHQYRNPGIFLPGPVIDDLLPERPIDAIRSGSAEGIKLIIGTTRHEGTTFVHPEKTGFPNSWAMVSAMMETNGHADHIPPIISYYIPSAEPFIEFATDYAFQMPAIKVAEGQRLHAPDVWMYRYELVTKSGEKTGWKASHAFELPAMFAYSDMDFSFNKFIFDGEPRETLENMAQELHGDWVRFVKTGEPNPDWPRYAGHKSPVRIYDRMTRTEQLDRTDLMKVWDDLRFYED